MEMFPERVQTEWVTGVGASRRVSAMKDARGEVLTKVIAASRTFTECVL